MDRSTVDIYEDRGWEWAAHHPPVQRSDALAFARTVPVGALRVDLGCGTGRYTSDLGAPCVGLDAARAMLERCRSSAPGALLVQADLEALPFGTTTLHGGWAHMSYLHVPSGRLPAALGDLHRTLVVGAPVEVQVLAGDHEGDALPADRIGGRFFAAWTPQRLSDVLVGAGFEVGTVVTTGDFVRATAGRARTLSDVVGPGMQLLVVGLNPSLYSADVGVGYGRPGNRFWPAALDAGLVTRDRDPGHALRVHGMGMTDVVKRATSNAASLAPAEYRTGMARVERLVRWLTPEAVCFVGLTGWRQAVNRGARAGPQQEQIGGRPVYVMPSTSGANAHARIDELSAHLRAARAMTKP
ncbi:MAG TPA: methyltransferase domain-containing protein [Acidimicrobiales bacterium]|nr:methyltransferase domain-containing protein [Acidimicrobiales bacterium]